MKKIIIATHDGIFHPDEVFAIATICMVAEKEGKEIEVIRTRDSKLYEKADMRVDVGLKYDDMRHDFDHHQDPELPASCTLVWIRYGENLCSRSAANFVRKTLLDPISGLDVNFAKFAEQNPVGIYKTVGQAVLDFNDIEGDQQTAFMEAVSFAKMVLRNTIRKGEENERNIRAIEKAEKIGQFGLLLDWAIPYNEYRSEFGSRFLLCFPDPVNGWCVVSLDTTQANLSGAQELNGAVFAHKAGFFAKFATKGEALTYLAHRDNLRGMEIVQWDASQNR